jgi:DNA modification methylase
VACKNLGRHFIGIEINPQYVEIAEQRLNEVNRLKEQALFEI